MVMSNRYQNQPKAVATYSYSDIASGTGYINYYGYTTTDSVGTTYHLTTQSPRSSTISTVQNSSGSFDVDHDFDLPSFRLPQIVRGTAIITGSCFTNGTNVGDTFHIIYTLKRVRGGTETTVGTVQTETYDNSVTTDHNITVDMTCSQTHFAPDDVLRLTVNIVCTAGGGAAGKQLEFGHDPQNRDGGGLDPSTDDTTTILKIEVPYRLDI